MDEVEVKAAILLKPYWDEVTATFGADPSSHIYYRAFIQEVVVGGRMPRAALEDRAYLKKRSRLRA